MPICRKCGVLLTDENWNISQRNCRNYICKNCKNIKNLNTSSRKTRNKSNIPIKICRICEIPLTEENCIKYNLENNRYWCDSCRKEWDKNYRKTEKRKEYNRNYRRHHHLNIKGHSKFGINKRKYPEDNLCEICKKSSKRMDYHHWNDDHPEWGIWCCHRCHFMMEGMDKGNGERYKEIRNKIGENEL